MKTCTFIGCILVSALCSCATSNPNSETVIDTSTQTKQTLRPEAPPQPPLSVPIGPE